MKVGELRKQGFKAIAGDTLTNGLSDSIKLSIGGAVAVNNGYHDELEVVDLLWRNNTSEAFSFRGDAEYSLDGWKPYLGKVYIEGKSANSNNETPVFTQAMADANEFPPVGSKYSTSGGVFTVITHGKEDELDIVCGKADDDYLAIHKKEWCNPIKTRTKKQKAVDAAIAECPVADKATLELAYDLWAQKIEQ